MTSQNAPDPSRSVARFSAADLQEILNERILVFDGAMGTSIQNKDLDAAAFGGPELEGCNENIVVSCPDVLESIHTEFLAAGADVIETDTFGGTPLVLAEYGLADQALHLNAEAARLARRVAARFDQPGRPRLVAGSMGPTTKTISVTGGATFDEMAHAYEVQAEGLVSGGADLLIVETSQDTLNVKAAFVGIERVFARLGVRVPLLLSVTIEPMGTMLAGQGVEALYTSVEHVPLVSVGLNCATGPDFMTDHLRALSEMATTAVSCMPNAGLPDEDGIYHETPDGFAAKVEKFVDNGWINIIGGCCGTVPEHIARLRRMVDGKTPRRPATAVRGAVSGIEYLPLDEYRPCIVGERTNVIGSRKFKELIVDGKFEEASEIGRRQVRGGAHVVDVCLANPDREELEDMNRFLEILVKKVKVPILIDSTDAQVIEEALKRIQGKAVINSINLEDGEERFEQVIPLVRRYGAAVVVGCIDDDKKQGMAVSRQRKLEVARRSLDLLTGKYGVPARDIIFDPLVFPCGTGDANYVGSARETIEGVRLIDEAFPECRTILGISNVSFGLPANGREVLNTVFLHQSIEAGLDLAIVNSERLERITHIPPEERRLAEDLIDSAGADPVKAFADHFKAKEGGGRRRTDELREQRQAMSLDERLALCVVEGSKDGLEEDLARALKDRKPLDIINGPLLAGMDEVGRLFGANKLIVAEVLQSAEVMKAAVSFLEPHMTKSEGSRKGRIMLATVKGDVHDIGKNLVEIIISNNGFEVINLGIKVPPADLISAYSEHRPDLIGLSGLLVKSAQQMVTTAQDLREAGIEVPILVGGAALSEKFTYTRIQPAYGSSVAYAKDAMNGLDLANRFVDPQQREGLLAALSERRERMTELAAAAKTPAEPRATGAATMGGVRQDVPRPSPPDYRHHVIPGFDLGEVFEEINPTMLFGHHLGLKGRLQNLLDRGDTRAKELHAAVVRLQDEVIGRGLLKPRAVYQFFRAASRGDDLEILVPDGSRVLQTFRFPRQSKAPHLCLSDYVASAASSSSSEAGPVDSVCFFVTTCGDGVRTLAEEWKAGGEYLRSHALQALALESAEALAELLHRRIRTMWGIGDPKEMTREDRWKARYQGIRVSFGYPACPRLEDQELLWRLLEPDKHIGVCLTDGAMMDPEASVSALVFHHPEAKYFAVTEEDVAPLEANRA